MYMSYWYTGAVSTRQPFVAPSKLSGAYTTLHYTRYALDSIKDIKRAKIISAILLLSPYLHLFTLSQHAAIIPPGMGAQVINANSHDIPLLLRLIKILEKFFSYTLIKSKHSQQIILNYLDFFAFRKILYT